MRRLFILTIMLLVSASAQSATIDPLTVGYEADAFDTPPQSRNLECAISLKPAHDMRVNKETFGATYLNFKPILSGPVTAWVDAGMKNLAAFGAPLVPDNDPAGTAKSITLQPSILYSYLWYGPIRINATVVINIDYTLPSGEKVQRIYRANGSKVNWAGTDGEHITTLNYALNGALAKIDQELRNLCTNKPSVLSAK